MESSCSDSASIQLSKKEKRLESKKRKAAAFLQLVKEADKVKEELADTDDEVSEAKKKKLQTKITADGDATRHTDIAMKRAEDELAEIRLAMKERQMASMKKPKLYLTLDELASQYGRLLSKDFPDPKLPPLFMLDVQHLLSCAVHGNLSHHRPRWCRLLRTGKLTNVAVVVLDSVSNEDFNNYKDCFSHLTHIFKMSVEMVSPSEYGSSVAEELFHVPFTLSQLWNLQASKEHKKLVKEFLTVTDPLLKYSTQSGETLKSKKKISHDDKKVLPVCPVDKFPRTHLLMNPMQMIVAGYPMPSQRSTQCKNFVFTNKNYKTVTDKSPMFALDCEMCVTTRKNELTRVSVVNEQLEVIYDTFVKPFNRITNYVTRYSGITKEILDPVKTRLSDVQKKIQELLPSDAILCGQSLNGDLNALELRQHKQSNVYTDPARHNRVCVGLFQIQMFHPYVIDTSVIYNLTGFRYKKTGLRALTQHFLGKSIQDDEAGHDSREDATATMELVLLKLSKNVTFGDCIMGGTSFPEIVEKDQIEGTSFPEKEQDTCQTSSLSVDGITMEKTHFVDRQSSNDIQRNRKFFQRNGSKLYQNFFELLRKSTKKTVALVDEKEVVDMYSKQDIVTMVTDCDRTSKSLCKSYVQFHDFVYVNFPSYKHSLKELENDEETKKKTLTMMDNRMWKVLKHVKENSLIVVILSGRLSESSTNHSARTFVRIV